MGLRDVAKLLTRSSSAERMRALQNAVRREMCQADENERSRIIGDITKLMNEPDLPESTRTAGLTLIGWLARRMPHETPHALGVTEARESERRMRAARTAKSR